VLEYIPEDIMSGRPASVYRITGRENVGIVYTLGKVVDALDGDFAAAGRNETLPRGWTKRQTASAFFVDNVLKLELRDQRFKPGGDLFGEIILASDIEIANCNACRMLKHGTYAYSVDRYGEKSVITDVRLRQNHWCRFEEAPPEGMPPVQ
jgi:hypothetical protein